MTSLMLLLGAVALGQGQAALLAVPHEPGLEAVSVSWRGRDVPFARSGERWTAVVGADLSLDPGAYDAPLTLVFDDGRERAAAERVEVAARDFPTTELEVEPRYVELSPEDQARAAREAREIDEIYTTLTPERYWSGPFQIPVPGVAGGRNFGHRRVFNGQSRNPHSGADLRAATGTPIEAANRGRVVLAKDLFFSGNAVFLDHGHGLYTVYLHLSEIGVEPGRIVERGEVVGLAGATGRVTGPHLHWGARVLDARVDPFTLVELGSD